MTLAERNSSSYLRGASPRANKNSLPAGMAADAAKKYFE
jgi:hypothetical protein